MPVVVEGNCPESRCTFSTDKSVENQAAADAVVFHMPNYHWEKYSSPELRNPSQNWIFMSYESATNVRVRYYPSYNNKILLLNAKIYTNKVIVSSQVTAKFQVSWVEFSARWKVPGHQLDCAGGGLQQNLQLQTRRRCQREARLL